MIVSTTGDGRLALVRQVDHQDHCADLAAAWGNRRFARPEPWGPLAAAAAWHDEGWRAWERRPGVDGAGRPEDFPDIDRADHVALYRAGIDVVCGRDARAGLLVSLHGTGLYLRRRGLDRRPLLPAAPRPAAVATFLAHERARQERLRTTGAACDPAWEWAGYRLLQAWDLLSLALLWGRLADRPVILPRVPRGAEDDEGVDMVLTPAGPGRRICDPWPFRGREPVVLAVAMRHIADRPHRDAAALAAALTAARWERLTTEILPA